QVLDASPAIQPSRGVALPGYRYAGGASIGRFLKGRIPLHQRRRARAVPNMESPEVFVISRLARNTGIMAVMALAKSSSVMGVGSGTADSSWRFQPDSDAMRDNSSAATIGQGLRAAQEFLWWGGC
ncbi:MAG TPA: hypothetical protein VL147_23755, partial [Devosia sp.]|nr:hypothetical protein [Devosia sp.]